MALKVKLSEQNQNKQEEFVKLRVKATALRKELAVYTGA